MITRIGLLLLLCSGVVSAQSSYSIYGGFGQSGLGSGSDLDVATDRLDAVGVAHFGVRARLPLTDWLSFAPGLEYVSRGSGLAITEEISLGGIPLPLGARAKTRFSYLEAPLLLRAELPTEGGLRPYLLAGPSVGYAVGGRVTTAARALIELDLFRSSIDLNAIGYERFALAATGGVGAEARLSERTGLFLEARYTHDFTQPYDVPLLRDRLGFQAWNIGAGVSVSW